MTQDAIVEKLRAALSDEVDSECQVLYILAESRKLLDKYPPVPLPFALKLYCHWALHIDLTNPKTTIQFMTRVDDFVGSVLGHKQDVVLEYGMLREFVLLTDFREQFKNFLQAYNLPTAVCEDETRWHKFLKSYAGIIEDGSLSCEASGKSQADSVRPKVANALKLVSKVVFNKGRPAQPKSYFPFDLSWDIFLLDGKTMKVEVQAANFSGDIEGIVHVISLR